MSKKRSNSVSITKETAKEFLPTELHKVRSIDLKELAARARDAIEGSESIPLHTSPPAPKLQPVWVSTQGDGGGIGR